jgi:hypothetical protein
MSKSVHCAYCFAPEIVERAVWLLDRFTLSSRDGESLLAERGIAVSCNAIPYWAVRFGPITARLLAGVDRARSGVGMRRLSRSVASGCICGESPIQRNSLGAFLLNLRDVILQEMIMRSAPLAALLGASAFLAVSAIAQTNDAAPTTSPAHTPTAAPTSGPANLCQELFAYAEETATEPPTSAPADQASTMSLRSEGDDTGTQGGGSVDASTSTDTSSQEGAPPTAPVATGAAPEAASSPHASDSARAPGASPAGTAERPGVFTFAGGVTLQQLRAVADSGDRQACRRMAQGLRRAGADMPAELIALAAHEPDPEKRQ